MQLHLPGHLGTSLDMQVCYAVGLSQFAKMEQSMEEGYAGVSLESRWLGVMPFKALQSRHPV